MQAIATEFGLSLPISLRSFIGKPGFPSSGAITMADFLGKSASAGLAVFISGTPSGFRTGAGSVTTAAATATATGGTPGYSYAWTHVSGDTFTVNSESSASTTFTTTLSAGTFKEGVYRCTATDSVSASASSDITVYAEAFD
jgi:hypothetical protein